VSKVRQVCSAGAAVAGALATLALLIVAAGTPGLAIRGSVSQLGAVGEPWAGTYQVAVFGIALAVGLLAYALAPVSLLAAASPLADNGIKIPYSSFHRALTPGALGFLQYGVQTSTPLTSVHPAWTGVTPMISINTTSVPYQPDPGDPSSATTLPA